MPNGTDRLDLWADPKAFTDHVTTATPEYDVPLVTDMKKPAPRAWRLQGGPDHKEQEVNQ
jgi:hypothetical protein